MKVRDNRESFTVEADMELHQAILAARKAGRRYGKKLISCTTAFELGARILLGLEENEEETIKQDIEELRTQKAIIEKKEKLRLEQLQLMQVSKTAKMEQAAEQNNNVQKLANRILEIWDNVTLMNRRTMIVSLVDIDKTRLTRPKLEAVFPKKPTPKPSEEVAIKIAYELLEGELVGA